MKVVLGTIGRWVGRYTPRGRRRTAAGPYAQTKKYYVEKNVRNYITESHGRQSACPSPLRH